MTIRDYQPARDSQAAHRIWEETGWIERNNAEQARLMDRFLADSRCLVAELAGQPECLVSCGSGEMKYLEQDLSTSLVLAVTTSLVARKRGLASRLTARAIANEAVAGHALSALGMFEQGYYTRLGFGNGPYVHSVNFNPALLQVDHVPEVPVRLGKQDFAAVCQALANRWRGHGGVRINQASLFEAEMGWTEDATGFGYHDQQGQLSHFIWGSNKGEHGPFKITFMAYQNSDQLLELLALIRSMGNQVLTVNMMEPARLQFQDLLREPFKAMSKTRGSDMAEHISAEAYWQLRILDLPACISACQLPGGETLSFNLKLNDPISGYLDEDCPWQGVGGEYCLHLGQESALERNPRPGLPTLEASVGGFSRLWLGAVPATAISLTGELKASPALLEQLENRLRLPAPHAGMNL
jgi:predicted acetyltransferase